MITDIGDYFARGCGRCDRFSTAGCSTQVWADGLTHLRRLCLEAGLIETVKWGHPCYMHAGRNVSIIGAFRSDFRLSFFNAALMTDPDGILEKQGPNTRHRDMIRFSDVNRVAALAPGIAAYLREAMHYAEAGVLPPKEDFALDLPVELVAALAADPELARAFNGLTPGRRKSYVLNLRSAKASNTRIDRIARFRPRILLGKGATER